MQQNIKIRSFFLHSVQKGSANQSYGLHVAQLAGIPYTVIQHARKKLQALEQKSVVQTDKTASEKAKKIVFTTHPVLRQLKAASLDDLSPKAAHELLYQLQQEIKCDIPQCDTDMA